MKRQASGIEGQIPSSTQKFIEISTIVKVSQPKDKPLTLPINKTQPDIMPKHHLTKFTQIPPKSMYTESV
jgi:hypothetical protein